VDDVRVRSSCDLLSKMHWKLRIKEISRLNLQACSRTRVMQHTRQEDVVVESSDTVVIDTVSSKNCFHIHHWIQEAAEPCKSTKEREIIALSCTSGSLETNVYEQRLQLCNWKLKGAALLLAEFV
jgi:hypothetical protein